jgi:hypothetical protein
MGFDTHMIAGSRACSTSTRLTHSTITNQTSPHFAEALASPCGRPDAYARGSATVVLAGRATNVPFTTDASGRKRTPTDNSTAAMTCAVRRLGR